MISANFCYSVIINKIFLISKICMRFLISFAILRYIYTRANSATQDLLSKISCTIIIEIYKSVDIHVMVIYSELYISNQLCGLTYIGEIHFLCFMRGVSIITIKLQMIIIVC